MMAIHIYMLNIMMFAQYKNCYENTFQYYMQISK